MIKEFDKPVFKKCIKGNSVMTLEDYERLDEELDMIPLRFPFAFWNMHNYKDLIKKLLIKLFNLDSRYYYDYLYFGKDILLNNYPSHIVKTSLLITFNIGNWNLSKLSSLISLKNTVICNFLRFNDKLNECNTIYKLIFSTSENDYLYDIDYKNGLIIISFNNILNLKKRFFNGEYLSRREIILLIFCANNFKEMYTILCEIFDKREIYDFMKFMIEISMSSNVRKKYRKYKKYFSLN